MWEAKYETGNANVDREHREIFRLVQQVVDTKVALDKEEKIGIALNFLSKYTVSHFANEETLMTRCNYPAFASHKAIHDAFIKDVVGLINRFKKEGATDEIYKTVNNFVIAWLKEHIMTEDKKMADFYKAWKSEMK